MTDSRNDVGAPYPQRKQYHDPLCPASKAGIMPTGCQCDLIAKVAAREQKDADRRVDRQILRNALLWHDLRAKVKALRTWECANSLCLLREDVLALFASNSTPSSAKTGSSE